MYVPYQDVYVYRYICRHSYICIYIYIYVYVHVYIHVNVYVYVYVYPGHCKRQIPYEDVAHTHPDERASGTRPE